MDSNKKIKVVLDTNIMISKPTELLNEEYFPVLPFKTIQELDSLKRNMDLKFSAQYAIKIIKSQYDLGKLEIVDIPKLGTTPDEIIINSALKHGCSFLSEDIGANIIAKAVGVPIISTSTTGEIDYNYTGCIEVQGDYDYEEHFKHLKVISSDEFKTKFNICIKINQYIIVNRLSTTYDIWREWQGELHRVSQSSKPLKACGIVDVPMDSRQQCAIDAIINTDVPLTIISGKVGSGKSLCALMGACATTFGQKTLKAYKKVYVTRPPIPIDSRLMLGWLKGDLMDKIMPWLAPITSNLKFLFEKDLEKSLKGTADTIFEEYFIPLNLETLQGTNIHDGIVIVEEMQLADRNTLQLVLSRIAAGSKVILVGDFKSQTYGINRGSEGFKVLLDYLGKNEVVNYVELENIYRSKLSEFVDEVFN